MSGAVFMIEPRRGVKLRGKATRDGQVWTLRLDSYPEHAQTGFDLVKARAALEKWAAGRMAARERSA
jgi:hypothetical protein